MRWNACLLVLVLGCDPAAQPDAGSRDAAASDAAPQRCARDAECDDAEFCNGEERCVDAVCVAGDAPCPIIECVEAEDECVSAQCAEPDADGDGRDSPECGGDDCDDDDPNRFPGNPEVCDADDHDEDCDERTFGVRDGDGDGEPDALCCNGDNCGGDCDDTRAGVGPHATETCGDAVDNDCDGNVDEGVARVCYEDADRDTYAAIGAATMMDCGCPAGWTETEPGPGTADCNDDPAAGGMATFPGAAEVCDRLDNDCSESDTELLAETGEDFDEDEHAPPGAACSGGFPRDDCDDDQPLVHPGQLQYFERPFCPNHCDSFSIIGRGHVCDLPCEKTDLPSFDYDCSGAFEFPGPHVSCREIGPQGCTPEADSPCQGSGPTTAAAPRDCGMPVDYVACDCEPHPSAPLGGFCRAPAPSLSDLPCR